MNEERSIFTAVVGATLFLLGIGVFVGFICFGLRNRSKGRDNDKPVR